MMHFISIGLILGLSAGFSPGPLLTLVVSQTIKYNKIEGIKVALAPLLSDLPIILISLFILNEFSGSDIILSVISFAGGVYIAYLGVESLRIKGLNVDLKNSKSQSIKKGIITNFLSPSPYLFWATVGTPLLFKAYKVDILTTVLFLVSFYLFLIGSKIVLSFIVARTKSFINQKIYVIIMRFLGVALLFFSIMFFYEGVKYL